MGGVLAGVSMRVRAVGHELSILIGQQLRCKFLDFVRSEFPEPTRGNVQGSGNMSLAVVFGCEGLNNRLWPGAGAVLFLYLFRRNNSAAKVCEFRQARAVSLVGLHSSAFVRICFSTALREDRRERW